MFGLHNAHSPLSQSDTNVKSIASRSLTFPALEAPLSSHWLLAISTFLLIGRRDDLAFDLTTLNRKAFYIQF